MPFLVGLFVCNGNKLCALIWCHHFGNDFSIRYIKHAHNYISCNLNEVYKCEYKSQHLMNFTGNGKRMNAKNEVTKAFVQKISRSLTSSSQRVHSRIK